MKTYFFIYFLLFSTWVNAQQTLNLDFEISSIEGTTRPWGWDLTTFSSTEVQLDSSHVKNGFFSLLMNSEKTEDSATMQSLVFGIEPYELRGRLIEITGWIKTELQSGKAWASVGYSSSSDVYDGPDFELKSKETSGYSDWYKIELEVDIPDSANIVFVSINHQGIGKAWYDHFDLMIDDQIYTSVEVADTLSEQEMNWLTLNSYPIYDVDATFNHKTFLQKSSDLAPFKESVKNTQIIAMGESTHGTSEFFRLKNRILEFAVYELGVRIFAIEDNQVIIQNSNNFVQGGPGSARSAMAGMFSVWQNEEVRDLMQWIRDYNDQNPNDKVQFVGFDIQHLYSPIDSLKSFLEEISPETLQKYTPFLEDIWDNSYNHFNISDSAKLEWLSKANALYDDVSINKKKWIVNDSNDKVKNRVLWGIQYAKLIQQYIENIYRGHESLYRDIAMAENISWILNEKNPETKMLIWAHNYHISTGEHPNPEFNIYSSKSMGAHLRKEYGDNYKAFGIETYQGEYWCQISYFNFSQRSCPLYNSPRGTIDEALHRINLQDNSIGQWLDLSSARFEEWLVEPIPMRFANHVNIEYGYWTRYSIPYQFDGLFFIDHTSPAKSYSNN